MNIFGLALAATIGGALWISGAIAQEAERVDATLRVNGEMVKLTKALAIQNGMRKDSGTDRGSASFSPTATSPSPPPVPRACCAPRPMLERLASTA